MASNDTDLTRRWKRFIISAENLGKLAKGEVTAETTLHGAKFLGAMFIHDRAIIELWFERDDFPATRLGELVPDELLKLEPVIRIIH